LTRAPKSAFAKPTLVMLAMAPVGCISTRQGLKHQGPPPRIS
jgi:hypothetical protein